MSEAEPNPLRGALDKLTRPPVLTFVGGLQLALMLVVAGAHLATLQPPGSGQEELGTGDFLAFWTGAVLIDAGDGHRLYDFTHQGVVQARMLGEGADYFQPYLNPPLLALVLSPLVRLGYVPAFYVFALGCLVAFSIAIASLTREIATLAPTWLERVTLFTVALSFQPVIRTIFGGQNTGITLALLTGLYVATRRGAWPVAALLLGLLTFKPQYAIGMGLLLLLTGQWRIVAGGVVVGALHWGVGAVVCGAEWPLRMLDGMRVIVPQELAWNAHTHFSWVRVADYVLPNPIDRVVGWTGALVVLAALFAAGRAVRPDHDRFPALWAAGVAGAMLISPHLQYYDAGLLVLPAVLMLDHLRRRDGSVSLGHRLLLAGAYLGYPAYEAVTVLGFQPLVLVLLGMFGAALALLRSGLPQTEGSRPAA